MTGQFSFRTLPQATDEHYVRRRRMLIARGIPEYGYIEAKLAEVISRFSGENGLSDAAVKYLTAEVVKVFTDY